MHTLINTFQLDGGASSWVELLPGKTSVQKAVQPWMSDYHRRAAMIQDMRNERDIYNHLPKGHPRFLEMLSSDDTGTDVGIELPYMAVGSLRTYLEMHHTDVGPDGPAIPARLRARWAVEVADGIRFLHTHGVIHCDIKPHNMLLDDTLGVRIIDMAGSSLGDRPSTCCESDRFYMPRARDNPGTVLTDLFAVGMSLFEIVTGAQPYGEIEDRPEIIARYKRGAFPSLAAVAPPEAGTEPGPPVVKHVTKYMSKHNPAEVGRTGGAPANTSAAARACAPTDASGREVLFAETMRQCWHGQFPAAADLLVALAAEIRAAFSDADVAYIEEASGLSLQEATAGCSRPAVDGETARRST